MKIGVEDAVSDIGGMMLTEEKTEALGEKLVPLRLRAHVSHAPSGFEPGSSAMRGWQLTACSLALHLPFCMHKVYNEHSIVPAFLLSIYDPIL